MYLLTTLAMPHKPALSHPLSTVSQRIQHCVNTRLFEKGTILQAALQCCQVLQCLSCYLAQCAADQRRNRTRCGKRLFVLDHILPLGPLCVREQPILVLVGCDQRLGLGDVDVGCVVGDAVSTY